LSCPTTTTSACSPTRPTPRSSRGLRPPAHRQPPAPAVRHPSPPLGCLPCWLQAPRVVAISASASASSSFMEAPHSLSHATAERSQVCRARPRSPRLRRGAPPFPLLALPPGEAQRASCRSVPAPSALLRARRASSPVLCARPVPRWAWGLTCFGCRSTTWCRARSTASCRTTSRTPGAPPRRSPKADACRVGGPVACAATRCTPRGLSRRRRRRACAQAPFDSGLVMVMDGMGESLAAMRAAQVRPGCGSTSWSRGGPESLPLRAARSAPRRA